MAQKIGHAKTKMSIRRTHGKRDINLLIQFDHEVYDITNARFVVGKKQWNDDDTFNADIDVFEASQWVCTFNTADLVGNCVNVVNGVFRVSFHSDASVRMKFLKHKARNQRVSNKSIRDAFLESF